MTITTGLAPTPADGHDINPRRPHGSRRRAAVPDPLSVACELRDCQTCDGRALSILTGAPAPCTCRCHR